VLLASGECVFDECLQGTIENHHLIESFEMSDKTERYRDGFERE
jgi:hypothetical protein